MIKVHLTTMLKVVSGLLLALVIGACDNAPSEKQIESLKIGLLPDRNPAALKEQYKPLFDYVSNIIQKPYELIIPKDYAELVKLFENKSIDLAFFGGYTFVDANKNHNAIPLVMRDIDRRFLSVIAVRKGRGLNSLDDLKDTRFSFGSKLSTSGHLMPRYYMSKLNIIPETYFNSVEFSQAHNKTLQNVASGKVDAGVLNANVYNNMIKSDEMLANDLKVVWQSQPYPDYVWAGQSYLSNKLQNDLILAFLSLNYDVQSQKVILDNLDAKVFYPASTNDFEELQKAIALLEQMNE